MAGKAYIQSIQRAIGVLNLFEHHKELKLQEISRLTGLNKTTAYGILETLVHLRYLEKNDATSMYRLGLGLFRISQHVEIDLVRICRPHLRGLVDTFQETANLIALDGLRLTYLDKVESPLSMRICTQIGQSIPIYCSSAGKAILAHMPQEEMASILESMDFVPLTPHTLASREALEQQLQTVRKNGYATDVEEFEVGLLCMGVPLLDHRGYPLAAISVSAPLQRTNYKRMMEIIALLHNKAHLISLELNGEIASN